MKKICLVFALVVVALGSYAQNGLVSKKGEPILPEAGDWAISIDANPFLKYAGNFIGADGLNAAPKFDFISGDQTVIGKYFIDETKAYRLGFRFGLGSTSNTTKVASIPTPANTVENVSKVSGSDIGLKAGMEWRRGKTRLQGFYGAEAGLALGSSTKKNTFGNALSAANTSSRISEVKDGTQFGLGVRAFIGAEYFILPKISIGGEFGWGLALTTTGEGSTTSESWDGTKVKSVTNTTGGSSSFGFQSENLNSVFGSAGAIKLTLHF